MFLSSTLVILVVALGAFHTAQGHAVGRLQVFGTNIVAEVQGRDPASSLGSPKAWERSFHIELDERQSANSTCGTQAGGTSCAPDYCCSAEGICGQGLSFCEAPSCQFNYGPACDANQTPSGSNTSSIPRPQLGSISYTSGIVSCSVPGTVALTYDDGPYIYTSDLLGLLAKYNASVTFFITGNNYGKHGIDNASTPYPDLIRRMYQEGHQIASHTWSHQLLDQLTHLERMDQMIKNEMAFRNILGFFPTYMRPPYDSCTVSSGCRNDIAALGYHIVEYNINTYDYVNLTPDTIQISKDNVTAGLQGGSPSHSDYIIYSHDTHPQTVYNLTDFMLSTITEQGYRLVTIGECLGDPAENWYRNASTSVSVNISSPVATPSVPVTALQTASAAPASQTISQSSVAHSTSSTPASQTTSRISGTQSASCSGFLRSSSLAICLAISFCLAF